MTTTKRRPQIAVIGGASGPPQLLEEAEVLGRALVDAGWRIVCGGLGGVMEAAARGAHASPIATGGDVIGVLPGLHAGDANPWIDIVVPTGLQHARNALVVSSAEVVVAVGGGAGTLSEIAMAWQHHKPVVALATQGGWAAELAGRALDHRRRDRILAAGSVEEAVSLVRQELKRGRDHRPGIVVP